MGRRCGGRLGQAGAGFQNDKARMARANDSGRAAQRECRVAAVMVRLVCNRCATDAGGVCNHPATWHVGKCDVCGNETAVTEPRDFGYPKFSLDDSEDDE